MAWNRAGIAVVLLLVPALPAMAQAAQEQERVQELERQKQLQDRIIQPEFADESYFDYGGWVRPQYFQFRDGSDQVRARQDYDLRLWVDIRQGGVHTVYFRGAYYKFIWDDGDSPTGHDEKQKVRIDVAYYQCDVGVVNSMGAREPIGYLRLGRQYHVLGSGLVFNGNFDGGKTGWLIGPVAATVFGGRSIQENDDLDQSRVDPTESHRLFLSGLLEGNFSSLVVPYAFVLAQIDQNSPDIPVQKFGWDSQYWGLGARGNAFLPNFPFTLEYVYETGNRYASGAASSKERIDASALYAEVSARLLEPMLPQVVFGFMYASGDKNRLFVPNTFLGNAAGTPDHTFTAFGYVPTGFLFNPLLANLYISRAGASFRPIYPEGLSVRQVDFGVDFYYYQKVKTNGGISDPFMKLLHADVGWEVDLHADVTLFSDLTFQARYGHFHPGQEPLDSNDRDFFLIAAIFSF